MNAPPSREIIQPIRQFVARYRTTGRLKLPHQEWEQFSGFFQKQKVLEIITVFSAR